MGGVAIVLKMMAKVTLNPDNSKWKAKPGDDF